MVNRKGERAKRGRRMGEKRGEGERERGEGKGKEGRDMGRNRG